ncbi:MAG: type I-B CRISPR-associated protein Cas5 [Candidatus Coatesbacteria bacterium]|nr:type I-B CRISPR-associated protein Cas5 [Candidatus Coatesbacteria bacterium]
MDVLVFDIYGDWGHFRRYFSTTSPLSFVVPPRTTLAGMLGALLGVKRGEGPDEFPRALDSARAKIAVAPLAPLDNIQLGLLLIKTKRDSGGVLVEGLFGPHYGHTRIRYEFLRRPAYRLFVHLTDDGLMKRLEETLTEHHCAFTLSLGLSELLANYRFVGRFNTIEKEPDETVELHSAVTEDTLGRGAEPEYVPGTRWVKHVAAVDINPDREVTCYEPVFAMITPLRRGEKIPDDAPPPLAPRVPPLKCKPRRCFEVELPEDNGGLQRFCFLERANGGP